MLPGHARWNRLLQKILFHRPNRRNFSRIFSVATVLQQRIYLIYRYYHEIVRKTMIAENYFMLVYDVARKRLDK